MEDQPGEGIWRTLQIAVIGQCVCLCSSLIDVTKRTEAREPPPSARRRPAAARGPPDENVCARYGTTMRWRVSRESEVSGVARARAAAMRVPRRLCPRRPHRAVRSRRPYEFLRVPPICRAPVRRGPGGRSGCGPASWFACCTPNVWLERRQGAESLPQPAGQPAPPPPRGSGPGLPGGPSRRRVCSDISPLPRRIEARRDARPTHSAAMTRGADSMVSGRAA